MSFGPYFFKKDGKNVSVHRDFVLTVLVLVYIIKESTTLKNSAFIQHGATPYNCFNQEYFEGYFWVLHDRKEFFLPVGLSIPPDLIPADF